MRYHRDPRQVSQYKEIKTRLRPNANLKALDGGQSISATAKTVTRLRRPRDPTRGFIELPIPAEFQPPEVAARQRRVADVTGSARQMAEMLRSTSTGREEFATMRRSHRGSHGYRRRDQSSEGSRGQPATAWRRATSPTVAVAKACLTVRETDRNISAI